MAPSAGAKLGPYEDTRSPSLPLTITVSDPMGATFRFAGSTRATPEPDDADSLFWSPNSKLIGFYSHSKLKKSIPLEASRKLRCRSRADPGGATWNRDGIIVFAPNLRACYTEYRP
jgi:hypothetical protein